MQGQTYLGAKVGRSKTATLRLADLQISLDDDEEPRKILQDLPVKNFNQKEELRVRNEGHFSKWLLYLKHGFSVLLYGFGSKRQLLRTFAMSSLCDGGVLSISGHASNLTAKQIVIKALSMLQHRSSAELKGSSNDGMLQQIAKAPGFLYIILHNIDGSALRTTEAQSLLADLSACPNVALIASMDHVNTPLLWDKQMAARFNWLYFDVTTYAPYTVECASKPSLLIGRAEENTMQGAAIVLRTLVPNARRIFQILAKQQMQDPENGLSFHRLFKVCREKFLVSSEMTLRSHLTEFKDHQLIQIRRAQDGTDAIYIPFPNDTLATILADIEVAE